MHHDSPPSAARKRLLTVVAQLPRAGIPLTRPLSLEYLLPADHLIQGGCHGA